MNFPLFKDSSGKPSVSFTMLVISFVVITLWLMVSIVEAIAGLNIRPFDAATAMAYFTPIATLYFSRRWTTRNDGMDVSPGASEVSTDAEDTGKK